MKDRYHKKANVLGIDVSVMRVDKAVNVSMELMRGKGLPVIYFLSAISSLLCQNNEQSAEYVKSCNLILAGDRHIEMAVHHRQDNGQIPEGIGEFADNYLKRLFSKINRDARINFIHNAVCLSFRLLSHDIAMYFDIPVRLLHIFFHGF